MNCPFLDQSQTENNDRHLTPDKTKQDTQQTGHPCSYDE